MKVESYFNDRKGEVKANAFPEGITTLPEYVGEEPVQPVPPIGTLPPVQPVPPIGTLPPIQPVPPIGSLPIIQFPGSNQGSLSICMQRVSYVWLRNGENFWFFPNELSNNSLNGYRYNERAGWFNYSIPFYQIMAVTCVQS